MANELKNQLGFEVTLINPQFASGLDKDLLTRLMDKHQIVVTLEDSILDGGLGQKIASYYGTSGIKVFNYGLRKEFLDGYNANAVLESYGIVVSNICKDIVWYLSFNDSSSASF